MSCNDENASLLDEGQTGSICPDVEQTRSICNNDTRNVFKIQILVILLITLVTYFGIDTLTYSRNEWLQSKVHNDMFTNQNLTVSKICGKLNHSEPNYKKLARVQEVTAKWQMYNTIASKGVIIFTAFIYTAYTDCFGRRFLFILSSFSLFIHHFLTSLIIYFDADPLYLVGTEFLYGLTGSSYAFTAAYYSYIADLTKAGKERSMALFLAEAAYSIGGTIGTFSVGFYIKSTNFFFPSLTAACVQLIILLVCIFTIKESLPPGVRISPPPFCRVIKRSTAFFTSSEFKDRRYKFIILLFAFAFADMTVTHRKSMESLYQLGMPFCWNSSQIAIFATARSLGENIIGLGSMKLLQKCVTDVSISLLGAVTEAASLVIEGLATNSTAMYLATVPSVLNNLITPLIRSTMSALTSEEQQGALFANVALFQSVCSFIADITDNTVYAATLEVFNGFIFITLAGYCVVTVLLLCIFICMTKYHRPNYCSIQDCDNPYSNQVNKNNDDLPT